MLTLEESCGACPEAYNAYLDGKYIAHLRLRHGCFTAEVRVDGDWDTITVYTAYPRGNGMFENDEREHYLNEACRAVIEWLTEREKEKEKEREVKPRFFRFAEPGELSDDSD